jgi:hypothetical protein
VGKLIQAGFEELSLYRHLKNVYWDELIGYIQNLFVLTKPKKAPNLCCYFMY